MLYYFKRFLSRVQSQNYDNEKCSKYLQSTYHFYFTVYKPYFSSPPSRNDMLNPHFSDYSLLLQKGFRERAWAGTDLTLISAAKEATQPFRIT
jgi:hypothetical protein